MEVAVIGIDGLDPVHLQKWQDDLPTLNRLINEGSFSEQNSTLPPLTCPAWPTMYTGKQGGKHGVFSFTKSEPNSYEQVPVNFSDVHAESLWEALDIADISCGVINVPLTYPPSDLENGFVISGWPVPEKAEIASDEDVLSILEEDLGEPYRVNPFPLTAEFDQLGTERLYEDISEGMEHHRRAFTNLIERHRDDLDMFFGVSMAIDIASHNFAWDKGYLKRLYVQQDQALKDILEKIPDGTNVIVMSDHGHVVKGNYSFHINEWLRDQDYLTTTESGENKSLFERLGITQYNLIKLKNALGLRNIEDRIPAGLAQWIRSEVPAGDGKNRDFQPELVDWSRTEAYSTQQNLLTLNTIDKPNGVITEEEYNSVLRELVQSLSKVGHPDDDKDCPLVSDIYTKNEIFEGPFYEEAPDIVFIADGMHVNTPMGFAGEVFTEIKWGEHRQEGVLITTGPSFKEMTDKANDNDIKDVFPTILALLNQSIPEDADGTILKDRISSSLEPQFRESHDRAQSIASYSESESRDIEEQLKGLGYLD